MGLSGPLLFTPEQINGAPGPEVIAVLKLEPQAELQELLDALEPVALAAGLSWPEHSRFGANY